MQGVCRIPRYIHSIQLPPPLSLDPVRCFSGYASSPPLELTDLPVADLPASVASGRVPLWNILKALTPKSRINTLQNSLIRKHS